MLQRRILSRFGILAALWLATPGCLTITTTSSSEDVIVQEYDPADPGQEIIAPPQGNAYSDLRQHSYSEVGADFDPDISTDGKWLAFASTANSTNPDIYIKSTNGTAIRRLTTDPMNDVQPAISPDGTKVAWASNRNGNWDIFVTSALGGSGAVQVTRSYDDSIAPSWSPDGMKLCYCTLSSGEWKIWIYDFREQSETQIGPGVFPKWNPGRDARDPNFDMIVFQRARERSSWWYELWTIKADGTAPTQILASNSWGCINPSWRKDGKKIVFCTVYKSMQAVAEGRVGMGDDIFVIDPDGTNLTHITNSLRADWNPVWGHDGRIYFSSDRNGFKNIWSIKPWVLDMENMGAPAAPELEMPRKSGMNATPAESGAAMNGAREMPEAPAVDGHANPLGE